MDLIETSDFVADATALVAAAVREALAARGECVLGLCGGRTPEPVYAALAGMTLPRDQMLFTFGDERCVPPDDPQSNYGMVRRAWFDPAQVPEDRILRMRGELAPETAAREYEALLAGHGRRLGHPHGLLHDVLLLGMGGDGHTASLFPGTAGLEERKRDVAAHFVPTAHAWRLTLTYPILNRARRVFFLVNDPSKRPVVDAVRAGDPLYPASGIRPVNGSVTWVVGI